MSPALSSLCRRALIGSGLALSVALALPSLRAAEGAPAIPVTRMMEVGPETETLRARCGEWDVICTIWPAPGADPLVTSGLQAQRTMMGLYMAETMKPTPGPGVAEFTRMAYQTYSRVEGRWQYVSLDTRMPVGIMPAYTFGKAAVEGTLSFVFEPIAFAGVEKNVEGHMMRSNLILTRDGDNHEFIRQHFIRADGSEKEWLAVQYEYRRKK